ncbi:hypothetical protein NIES4101_48600 [Calothrix sp. NIES-4101]|nr:hypothetical protein NIES4101_48600 [Calothrix sp. NIES-4101]
MLRKVKHTNVIGVVLGISGCLGMTLTLPSLPAIAQVSYWGNDYRACAGRLLRLGINAEEAAQACAQVLRPREFSTCVTRIQKQTQIAATDILPSCRLARRPDDLGTCVVGISASKKEAFDPSILNYCNRSLLPVRFAQCVVGLRSEVDFSALQAMDTCIDGSDKLGGLLPSFIPANQTPIETPSQPTNEFNRTFETTPIAPQPTPVPQKIVPQRN